MLCDESRERTEGNDGEMQPDCIGVASLYLEKEVGNLFSQSSPSCWTKLPKVYRGILKAKRIVMNLWLRLEQSGRSLIIDSL
jgi:hypothetical protein